MPGKKTIWPIHAILRCAACDKEWTNHRTAQRLAADHARNTGHEVRGEVGYAVVYNEGNSDAR